MKSPPRLDEEAAVVAAKLPTGFRVAILGSTSFRHEASEAICTEIGACVADLEGLVLLTGGVTGVGERVGRSYAEGCRKAGRHPAVIHVLPHGRAAWNYGVTLHAGDDMAERREILGRLVGIFIVVEGGPGTAHETDVASAQGALLLPVGRSGGHAGTIYPSLTRPAHIDARAWKTLGSPEASPRAIATAVAEIISHAQRRRA